MDSENVILSFMEAVSNSARTALPQGTGFVFFVAENHDDAPTSYMRCISNIEPEDLIRALELWAEQNRQKLDESKTEIPDSESG